ncbi:filamentous hemagglutinin family N-terminal domain-containing protein [Parelusimicrobium proximum]|uniref:hemagglutinin repeat-containing protein n=1 Tax=Parelusimicrobium proximum TaxID=3228953 RepID=UPI003D1798B7
MYKGMLKKMKKLVVLIIGFNLSVVPVIGQVLPDGSTATYTTYSTSNKTPVVNIAVPNGKGVSHNKYSDYNVDRQGLILNNTMQDGLNSVLGGYVEGNPNLIKAGREAKIILNEVTSNKRTSIAGDTEVLGAPAEVVVANANGINISGGRFINAPKVTLITGTPRINGDGSMGEFALSQRGSVRVAGLDREGRDGLGIESDGVLNLVSRSVNIYGSLFGEGIGVYAGNESYNYAGETVRSISMGTGGMGDEFGIDASNLGSMYGGRIRIVGTEAGFGVKTRGELVSDVSDIEITSAGDVVLAKAVSAGDVKVRAGTSADIEESYASGDTEVRGVNIGYDSIKSSGEIYLEGDNISHRRNAEAGKGIVIKGGRLDIDIDEDAEDSENVMLSYGDIDIDVSVLNNKSEVAGFGDVDIYGSEINNEGLILANKALNLYGRGDINNKGKDSAMYGGEAVNIRSNGVLHNYMGSIYGGGDINIGGYGSTLSGGLLNEGGLIQASAGSVNIKSEDMRNISIDNCVPTEDNPCYTYDIETGLGWGEGVAALEGRWTPVADGFEALERGRILASDTVNIFGGNALNRSSVITAGKKVNVEADEFLNVKSHIDAVYRERFHMRKWKRSGRTKRKKNTDYYWFEDAQYIIPSLTGSVVSAPEIYVKAYGSVQNGNMLGSAIEGESTMIWGPNPVNSALEDAASTGILDPLGLYDYGANGMFKRSGEGSQYLYQTNNRFMNLYDFIGSDYFMSQMGFNSDKDSTKWLGDAVFEQRMLEDAIIRATGNHYLHDDVANMNDQMKRLYDNAMLEYEAQGLEFGRALTADQINNLTSAIVWYVEQEVDGVLAMVPVLYLPSGERGSIVSDSLDSIQGGNITIDAGDIKNSGIIIGENVALLAKGDIVNYSGIIEGSGSAVLDAGGDILNVTHVNTIFGEKDVYKGPSYSTLAEKSALLKSGAFENIETEKELYYQSQWLGDEAVIGGGNVTLRSGGDIVSKGGSIAADEDVSMTAGGGILIGAAETVQYLNSNEGKNVYEHEYHDNYGSTVYAGGNISMSAGDDVTVQGSNIIGFGDIDIEGENVNILSAQNTGHLYTKSTSEGFLSSKVYIHGEDYVSNVGSNVLGGGDINISARQDVTLLASTLGDIYTEIDKVFAKAAPEAEEEGGLKSVSGEMLKPPAGAEPEEQSKKGDIDTSALPEWMQAALSKSGSKGLTSYEPEEEEEAEYVIREKGTINISAGRDINILAGEDMRAELNSMEKSSLGGLKASKDEAYDEVHTWSASTVFAGMDLNMQSGSDTTIFASNVGAAGDGNIEAGGDLNILAGKNTDYHYEYHMEQSISFEEIAKRLDPVSDFIFTGDKAFTLNAFKDVDEKFKNMKETGQYETDSFVIGKYEETETERYSEEIAGSQLKFGGSAKLNAGGDINITASDIKAAEVSGEAENINIQDLQADSWEKTSHTEGVVSTSSGINIPFFDVFKGGKNTYDKGMGTKEDIDSISDNNSNDKMKDKYWGYVNTAVNTLDTINSLGGFADGAKGAKDVLSGGKTADKIMEEINIFYGRLDIDGEKSESSSASSISHGSTIESIGDINLTSRGDITQKGSDAYSHLGDISYTAGGDIDIRAGQSTYKSSEDSTDVHFGAQFNFNPWAMANWSLDLEMSFQDSEADQSQTWHTNSTVQTQYGNVSMTSGEDLTVKGGNIYGNTVNIEAENLTIESIQDTSDSSSLSYGASTNITVGKSGVKGFGASANASWSESESAWVNQQSGIVSNGELTVSVKDKTELIGGVIGSETGEMTLSTGSLEYRDIEDYDYSESYSIKTGQSWGTQPANQSDSTGKTPGSQGTSTEGGGLDKIDPSKGSNTLGGTISGYDKEQLTKATIGEGTIIIKGEEQSEDSEAIDGLNRDLDATQVITRDEETGGLDAEITVSNDWFTRPGEKTKNILDLPENLFDISGAIIKQTVRQIDSLTPQGRKNALAKEKLIADIKAKGTMTQAEAEAKMAEDMNKQGLNPKDSKDVEKYFLDKIKELEKINDNLKKWDDELNTLSGQALADKQKQIADEYDKLAGIYAALPAYPPYQKKMDELNENIINKIADSRTIMKALNEWDDIDKDPTTTIEQKEAKKADILGKILNIQAKEYGVANPNIKIDFDDTSGIIWFGRYDKTSGTVIINSFTGQYISDAWGTVGTTLHEGTHHMQWIVSKDYESGKNTSIQARIFYINYGQPAGLNPSYFDYKDKSGHDNIRYADNPVERSAENTKVWVNELKGRPVPARNTMSLFQ